MGCFRGWVSGIMVTLSYHFLLSAVWHTRERGLWRDESIFGSWVCHLPAVYFWLACPSVTFFICRMEDACATGFSGLTENVWGWASVGFASPASGNLIFIFFEKLPFFCFWSWRVTRTNSRLVRAEHVTWTPGTALDKVIALALGTRPGVRQETRARSVCSDVRKWPWHGWDTEMEPSVGDLLLLRWGAARQKQRERVRPNSDKTTWILTSNSAKAEALWAFGRCGPQINLFLLNLLALQFLETQSPH